ncbi:MAG: IclR family transcriptional regulator [Acidimicrobiia bacterium]|nr:IclR family transcriptional regulator [Acidimicrobiia bacterium]
MATHQSLHRAVTVLRAFTEAEPALTVTEVADRTNLHKSTASRLLAALLDDGLVRHDRGTGRYSLGMGVVELAGVALGQIDVRGAAMPHMEALAAATGETVSVVVRRGTEAITVAHQPGTRATRHVAWIGRRMPLRSTAAGRAILASMLRRGDDWRAAAGTDVPGLAERLGAIADAGVAHEDEAFEAGVAAVAAPIPDRTGAVDAAVALSGPADRFDRPRRDEAATTLVAAASAIATDLGLREPARDVA